MNKTNPSNLLKKMKVCPRHWGKFAPQYLALFQFQESQMFLKLHMLHLCCKTRAIYRQSSNFSMVDTRKQNKTNQLLFFVGRKFIQHKGERKRRKQNYKNVSAN